MHGKPHAQLDFLTVVNLNAAVPANHPVRAIKRHVDAVWQRLSPLFDELYADAGRGSLPPEQLLKARVLTALCSVRSERLFCEQLGYNLLWLWFLDREYSEGSFNHSVFAKNYERVLSAEVAKLFFAEVYDLSRQEGWTSDEHFSADGTLIESWACLKRFTRKDGTDGREAGRVGVGCTRFLGGVGGGRRASWRRRGASDYRWCPRSLDLRRQAGRAPAANEGGDGGRWLRDCFKIEQGPAAGLLPLAGVGLVLAARFGDAQTKPPWPTPKSLAAGSC